MPTSQVCCPFKAIDPDGRHRCPENLSCPSCGAKFPRREVREMRECKEHGYFRRQHDSDGGLIMNDCDCPVCYEKGSPDYTACPRCESTLPVVAATAK